MRKSTLSTIVVLLLLAGLSPADDTRDDEFLAGLRARRLYQLAEDYCVSRLQEEGLSEVRRSELIIELSVTLVDRALDAAPEKREDFWRRAWEVTDQFAGNHPDHPRLLLVKTQGAMAQVARGELGRQEAEVLAEGGRRREEAREILREALETLRELNEQVAEELRERSMPGRQQAETPGTLTAFQLTNLQEQIEYQTARALRNQALCYPADSPDRADALNQAVALLDKLGRLEPEDPLAWPSRIEEIACLRLLKDYPAAAGRIEAAEVLEPSGEAADQLLAEKIRLALATGDLPKAVGEANQVQGLSTPELDFARLESALAAWQAATSGDQAETAEQWQQAAVDLANRIAQAHGPYWSRRAKLLLASCLKSAPGSGNLEMWAQAAESAYLSGQYDEAIATYEEAAELAREQDNSERAFRYALLAATIERERGRHAEALDRYRRLATAYAVNPRAAEAHQLAIREAARIAQSGEADAFETFVALLEEHLENWPDSSTSDGARWQLARVHASRSHWTEAVGFYRQITSDFERFDEVMRAVERCYRNRIKEARAVGEPVAPIAAEAARWFESLVLSADGRPPERWSPRARQAVLSAAEFWLHAPRRGFDRAEAILQAALSGAAEAPEAWRSAAQSLRVSALAGQGRRAEADAILRQVSGGSTDRLLAVLEGLARLAEEADSSVRRELANLQLQTIDLLRSQSNLLTAGQLLTLQRLSARALRDAGRTDDALAAYEQLAQKHPDDGAIQEELAGLLAAADDRRSLERALSLWRQIEKRSPTATRRWFRAKYGIALAHYRLGNPDQARKIITLVELLHPELGGPKLKADFLALLEQCGG